MRRYLIKTKKVCFLIILIFMIFLLPAEVFLDPPELLIDPQVFSEGIFERDVRIENRDERPLNLSLVTQGEKWSVEPVILELAGGESSTISLKGPVPEENPGALILLSEREDVPYLYSIRRKDRGVSPLPESSLISSGKEVFVFFYTPGCSLCDEFYEDVLPGLLMDYSLSVKPEKRNIYDSGNFEMMRELLTVRGVRGDEFPILIWGNEVYQGEKALFQDFPASLDDPDYPAEKDSKAGNLFVTPETSGGNETDPSRLHWLPVFLAGLLDGINPCAFTTLIFLISYLRLMGRRGREILMIGGSFTSSVFITYFLIGMGLFQMIRLASSFNLISQLIRFGMIALLVLLSCLSLYDYFKIRQGRAGDSILQLSGASKKRIHRIVRQRARSPFLLISSFAAGIAISLYELGCTGQIYLPMLVYMVRQNAGFSAIGLLFLYNFGFILPLVLVFLLFYKGSDSGRIADFFNRRLGAVKLTTALLFALIALLLLLWS